MKAIYCNPNGHFKERQLIFCRFVVLGAISEVTDFFNLES
jgi:hypothetical protein